jgi:hypothetical protein
VPLFQWTMLAGYVTFVEGADLERAWAWFRRRLAPRFGEPLTVIYDGGSERVARQANVFRALDIFGRLDLVDLRAGASKFGLTLQEGRGRVLVATPSGPREGFPGLTWLARKLPLLWPLAVPSFLPGAAKRNLRAAEVGK